MKEQEKGLGEKGEKLKQYLDQLEHYQVLLLDMLRAKELTQAQYGKMIEESQTSYEKFRKDLHKNPIDESQLRLDLD